MKPAAIKFCIRVLATLGALVGVLWLFLDLALFLPEMIRSGGGFSIALVLLVAASSCYLIYISYLVWFRWSPLAVRRVIGALAFMLFSAAIKYTGHLRAIGSGELSSVLFLTGLLLAFSLYNGLASYCCARLFPSVAVRRGSPAWKSALACFAFAAVLGLIVFSWYYQLAHLALR